jgi:hypothetical protein
MNPKQLLQELDNPGKTGALKIAPKSGRRVGRPHNYLGVHRLEKHRRRLATVLGDIYSVIPVQDWGHTVSVSEQLAINNPLLSGIIADKAMGVVGDSFDWEFIGDDSPWAEKHALPYLADWRGTCDVRGVLTYGDFQYQKSTMMDASGDVFRHLTRKKNGEAAIQLIRAHRIGQRAAGNTVMGGTYAGYTIENGVISDPETGEVVAYNLLGDTPEADRQIPRGPMTHLIDPIFCDQVRGLPGALAGLRALVTTEAQDENNDDFLEMMSRLWLTGQTQSGTLPADFSDEDEETSEGPATVTKEIMNGMAWIFQAGAGEEIKAFDPGNRPSAAWNEVIDRRNRSVCVAMGWPYEIAWKLEGLTSVGVHSVEQKARRTIRDRQGKIVPSAVQEIKWAIACAMDAGLIPYSPDWDKWGVTLPPAYSLNPTKAAESRRKDLELGLTTVGRILKEEGTAGGAKALFRERAKEVAAKKTIRDEISEETKQPIADWEMGRPPAGMAVTVAPTPNENDE